MCLCTYIARVWHEHWACYSYDPAVLGRCFINATEAVTKLTEITETLGLTEAQVSEQMANLIKLNQVTTYTHTYFH